MKFILVSKAILLAVVAAIVVGGCGGSSDAGTQRVTSAFAPVSSVNGLATFAYARSNYTITNGGYGYYYVVPYRGSEGTSTLLNAQKLKFADVTINLGIGSKSTTVSPSQLTSLIELYIAYFNRVPDADGLSFWIDQIKSGRTLDQIGESFYSAAIQYSSLTGYSSSMTNADFVTKIYKNVLGRTSPDQEGLDYWSSSLGNGTQSRGTLIQAILASAHTFKGDKTYGWVADLLDNRATVSHYFAVQQGLNYNSPEDSIARGMAIAEAVTPSDTLAATRLIGATDAGFNMVPIATVTNHPNLVLSQSVVTKSMNVGESQTISFQANASVYSSAPINIGLFDSKGAITNPSVTALSAFSFQVTAQTSPLLAPGVHDGFLEVRVCRDAPSTCLQPHPGSPWKVPYRFVVTSNLVVSGDAMSAATPEGTSIAFPSRPYTLAASQAALDYSVSYTNASGWLTVAGQNGQLQVTANSTGMKAGNYNATITIYGVASRRMDIPVTLTIQPGFSAPSGLSFEINNRTPGTEVGQRFTGTFSAALSKAWTVKSNQPWLVVDTPHGTGTSNTIAAHVDPALAAAFSNNTTQQALLTISADDGSFATLTVPVAVAVRLSSISGSAPFHVFVGESETVTITGANLDQLDLAALTMGGKPVINPKVVNPGQVTFQVPAGLAAGLQPVLAPGRLLQTISVPVIDHAGEHIVQFLPNATSNEPDTARRLVFDDGRNDLYASNFNGVAKYHYEAGTWTRSWRYIPDAVYAIALSPDRTTLVAAAQTGLYLIDVATFALTDAIPYPVSPYNGSALRMNARYASISFAPGGMLLLPVFLAPTFDLRSKTFVDVPELTSTGVLSRNSFGNQVFANASVGISTVWHDWQLWKTGATGFVRLSSSFECNANTVSVSRYAEVVSCGSNFYTNTGAKIGMIPFDYYDGSGYTVVSPDGKAAYSIRDRGFINAYQFADGFRKTASFKDSTRLYNVGYWDYDLYGMLNDALISQNGKTLFVALPTGIYVVPVNAFTPVSVQ